MNLKICKIAYAYCKCSMILLQFQNKSRDKSMCCCSFPVSGSEFRTRQKSPVA